MENSFKLSEDPSSFLAFSERELENVINKYLKPSIVSTTSKDSKITRESSSIPLINLTNYSSFHRNDRVDQPLDEKLQSAQKIFKDNSIYSNCLNFSIREIE